MTGYSLPSVAYVVAESQTRNNRVANLFSFALAASRLRQLWAAITRRPNGCAPSKLTAYPTGPRSLLRHGQWTTRAAAGGQPAKCNWDWLQRSCSSER